MADEGMEELAASQGQLGDAPAPEQEASSHSQHEVEEASPSIHHEVEAEVAVAAVQGVPVALNGQGQLRIAEERDKASFSATKAAGGQQHDEADALVQKATPWLYYAAAQAQGLKQTVAESTDEALKSARSQLVDLRQTSFHHFLTVKDTFGRLQMQYKYYEDIFFSKLKDGMKVACDHPTLSIGLASGAFLLLLRRPRRLLFRNTIGRFRSEEVMLTSAEKKVTEMRQSIDILQNESKKLEERVQLAEEELVRGQTKLKNAGSQIRSLVRTLYKTESQAGGLVDNLRELPGRDAIRLRAEVASMVAKVKDQRHFLDKKLVKITKYGIPA